MWLRYGLCLAICQQDSHDDKISVNNNELEASIDSINQRAKSGADGGFTQKLKNAILTEKE